MLAPQAVAAGKASGAPDFGGKIKIAAEAGSTAEAGPDQAAEPPARPDVAAVAARQTVCKTQWGTVDSNGDGIIDDGEVTLYNTVRADSQPVLTEADRLTEADFLATCSALAAHE
jgi:hypothetical protein